MRILPGVLSCLGACLVACAATDPGLRTANPPQPAAPADVDRADLALSGAGGIALYAQRWRPRTGERAASS
jgi:hypothetical protein